LFAPLKDLPEYKQLIVRVKAEQKFLQEAFREAINNQEASKSLKMFKEK
jgi:hypothetical protein